MCLVVGGGSRPARRWIDRETSAPRHGSTECYGDSVSDLVSLLNHLKERKREAHDRVAESSPLRRKENAVLGAYLGPVRGDIVYFWETTIDPAGADKVLAYEKAVESGSGWVLMQDGSLKTMDSSQFQAAPKAAK